MESTQQSKVKQPPRPELFEEFEEFEDESGFRAKDGNDYFYDDYGGWYDEFDNYYDHEGNPTDAPEDGGYIDPLLKDYDYNDSDQESLKDFTQQKQMELEVEKKFSIQKNEAILDYYHDDDEVKIYFSNMFLWSTKQDIKKWVQEGLDNIQVTNIQLEYDENDKATGNGSFYVHNKEQARKVISNKSNAEYQFKAGIKTLSRLIYLDLSDYGEEEEGSDEEDTITKVEKKEESKEDKGEKGINEEDTITKVEKKEQSKEDIRKSLYDNQQVQKLFEDKETNRLQIELTPSLTREITEQKLKDNFKADDFYKNKLKLELIDNFLIIEKVQGHCTTKDLKNVFEFLEQQKIYPKILKQGN